MRARDPAALLRPLRQPLHAELDGIAVDYVPFVAPPRPRAYGRWGAWAAPSLAAALRRLRRRFPYDLVHAHYAAPAGDAVRRARPGVPVVVSVHGGDLLAVPRWAGGERAVRRALASARLVLANSAGMAERARALGARDTRVVHLGTDLPPEPALSAPRDPHLVTVANLIARKRHADVLRALWLLREPYPHLRWVVVGDGPERPALERMADELGLRGRVEFRGGSSPTWRSRPRARAPSSCCRASTRPSASPTSRRWPARSPRSAARASRGPEEIAAAGGGMRLVPPGDPEALAAELRALLDDPAWRAELGAQARATVAAAFTWEGCGAATVAAYEEALR